MLRLSGAVATPSPPLPIFINGNLMLFAGIKNGMVHGLRTSEINGKNLCFFV
jgi:hypothetical protein